MKVNNDMSQHFSYQCLSDKTVIRTRLTLDDTFKQILKQRHKKNVTKTND